MNRLSASTLLLCRRALSMLPRTYRAESFACGLPTSFCASKASRHWRHAARPTAAVAPTLPVLLYRAAGATLAAPGAGVLWTAASQTTLRNSSRFLAHAPRSGTQGLAPRYKARTTAPSTPPAKFRAQQLPCRPSAGNRSRPRAQMSPKESRRRAGRPCAAAPRHPQNKPATRSSSRRASPPRR